MIPPSVAPTSEEQVFINLRFSFSLFSQLQRLICSKHGLDPIEYRSLRFIARRDGNRPALLSQRLEITPATTTDLIDRMEEHGLVRRVASEGDHRMTILEMTPTGLRRAAEVRCELWTTLQASLSDLGPDGKQAVSSALPALHESLRRRLPSIAPVGSSGD